MKRSAYYYLSFVAIMTGCFSSCEEEDMGYTAEEIKYKTEFVKEFGTPDPNHKWGFVDSPLVVASPYTYNTTRQASPNANMWGGWGLDVPYPLSTKQKEYVTKWFETHENPTGITATWTDYFAQQVSSTEYGKNMDELYDNGANSDNHVNNYNSGTCSPNGSVSSPYINGQYSDRIQYMTGQSTRAFSYHESLSDNTWYDHYVIIPGEMIDPDNELSKISRNLVDEDGKQLYDKKGNPIVTTESIWGMWFVAFDYEAKHSNPSQNIPRDYYFNDWIIRISPGTYTTMSQRVMCEDLGGSFDWDFNDVVFDAYIEGWTDNWMAHITIQCAGGTLPITVGTTDSDKEIHSLFGVSSSTVVIAPKAPAQYSVKLDIAGYSANVCQIPIYVNGVLAENIQAGNTPQRFACPVDTKWADELQCITKKYPNFPSWAQDQNTKNVWELHPNDHPLHPASN